MLYEYILSSISLDKVRVLLILSCKCYLNGASFQKAACEILLISGVYASRKMNTSLVHIYFTENVNENSESFLNYYREKGFFF